MAHVGDFEINDRRASTTRSISQVEANLRNRGFALPDSPVMARRAVIEAKQSVDSPGAMSRDVNRALTSSMRHTGSTTRTGGSVQMAIPKVREPMSSLRDKNIPFDTTDTKQLREIRKWARLFYSTHDLVPLLIDIYSKFPLVGLEFKCKDPKIKDFYEQVFMETLDYETFLQDLGREYFISGEVNSLGHFDETLGVFSSEEILNPDSLQVSKSMFVEHERVQLLVKDMVEALREAATAGVEDEATRSEILEKNWEYQQLVQHFPEIIEAAQTNDGLDISDALISRIVNKVQPWDLRGTPHLLRSFRTLMMEESLNAAQDAVADRLYSPFILATLGVADLGDRQPWIPDQTDLDETRDMMQEALAADFRLMVHNFGLKVESVFGREAVPRFDQDYARIDKKLMQAWGIGEALISGGTGSPYASSALNREFVTNMMSAFQKAVKKHMRKRCEIIAEAQGHYDYEMKGGVRTPIMREIVEFDELTGENYTRKIPRLLVPDIQFSTLNLRDESQERAFLQALRTAGVPISDQSLSVNIPIEFEEELEKVSEEKVEKLIAEAQAMAKAAEIIQSKGLPMPPDLARYLAAQAQLDKEKAGTDTEKANAEQAQQLAENPALALEMNKAQNPGVPGVPGQPSGGAPGQPGAGKPPGLPPGGTNPQTPAQKNRLPGAEGVGEAAPIRPAASKKINGAESSGGDGASDLGVNLDNGISKNQLDNSTPSPGFEQVPINQPILDLDVKVDEEGLGQGRGKGQGQSPLVPRNRTRPPESDEQRKSMPKKSSFGQAPSSYGSVLQASIEDAEASMKRLASTSQTVRDLVEHDDFFDTLNRQGYREQIRADIDTLYPMVEVDARGVPRLASADENLHQSFTVLSEMVDQYADTFGWTPEWA